MRQMATKRAVEVRDMEPPKKKEGIQQRKDGVGCADRTSKTKQDHAQEPSSI